MKKILALVSMLSILSAQAVVAKSPEETKNVMTVKSIQWQNEIETSGENKLLKAKVNFHYEGEAIDLGFDYTFNIHCQITRQRRGGTKYLFYEIRELYPDEPEAIGPADFSADFVFTFSPSEFAAGQKRTVSCGYGYSNGEEVSTVFESDKNSGGKRFRARGNAWKSLN